MLLYRGQYSMIFGSVQRAPCLSDRGLPPERLLLLQTPGLSLRVVTGPPVGPPLMPLHALGDLLPQRRRVMEGGGYREPLHINSENVKIIYS